MKEYHKIHSIYKRYTPIILQEMLDSGQDVSKVTKGDFILDQYSRPEFELLKDIEWEQSLKIDGTNIRIGYGLNEDVQESVLIGGRTSKAQIPKHLQAKLEKLFTVEKMKEVFGDVEKDNYDPKLQPKVVLIGEGVGSKIQKNGHQYLVNQEDEADFILFDIRIGPTWLRRDSLEEVAEQLGIRVAPIMGYGTLDEAIKLCQDGFKCPIREAEPEGLVLRPKHELLDRRGQRIITKVKLCDFR